MKDALIGSICILKKAKIKIIGKEVEKSPPWLFNIALPLDQSKIISLQSQIAVIIAEIVGISLFGLINIGKVIEFEALFR